MSLRSFLKVVAGKMFKKKTIIITCFVVVARNDMGSERPATGQKQKNVPFKAGTVRKYADLSEVELHSGMVTVAYLIKSDGNE